jgi:hypothetical protein
MDMLEEIKEQQAELLAELRGAGWDEAYADSETPFPKRVLERWISGGNRPRS